MQTRDLIVTLGGISTMARVLGVTPQTVSGWQHAPTIPPRHWLTVWRMAKERGLDWRPPGAEGLDLVILPPAADDADAPEFTQCSHPAPQQAAQEAA